MMSFFASVVQDSRRSLAGSATGSVAVPGDHSVFDPGPAPRRQAESVEKTSLPDSRGEAVSRAAGDLSQSPVEISWSLDEAIEIEQAENPELNAPANTVRAKVAAAKRNHANRRLTATPVAPETDAPRQRVSQSQDGVARQAFAPQENAAVTQDATHRPGEAVAARPIAADNTRNVSASAEAIAARKPGQRANAAPEPGLHQSASTASAPPPEVVAVAQPEQASPQSTPVIARESRPRDQQSGLQPSRLASADAAAHHPASRSGQPPRVHVGQVNVHIQSPSRPGPRTTKTSASDMLSRNFLKGL